MTPFNVHHIGIIVEDLEKAMDAYLASMVASFQVFEVDETMARFSGSSRTFRIRFAVGLAGGTSIEPMQPVSGRAVHSRHLDAHGPGVHHLAVQVLNLRSARARLERRGYPLVMDGAIDGVGQFAYYDAPDLGTIVEPLRISVQLPLFLARHARVHKGSRGERSRLEHQRSLRKRTR